jgi:hypothetical protein
VYCFEKRPKIKFGSSEEKEAAISTKNNHLLSFLCSLYDKRLVGSISSTFFVTPATLFI